MKRILSGDLGKLLDDAPNATEHGHNIKRYDSFVISRDDLQAALADGGSGKNVRIILFETHDDKIVLLLHSGEGDELVKIPKSKPMTTYVGILGKFGIKPICPPICPMLT